MRKQGNIQTFINDQYAKAISGPVDRMLLKRSTRIQFPFGSS